ncbi:MAG: dipeptidase PepE [Bacteroidia bacterium]|nr:dipeptidase PepE [Bacteroidia bacterium]NND52741.1 dipeptidase PepE [Flavobacteriaceae bacterium]
MKNVILASTSTVHGGKYLDYLLDELSEFFKNIDTITFIPYARPGGVTHDDYTKGVRRIFSKINKSVKGIQEYKNAKEAVINAEAIFVGGGNTFVLVHELYKNDLMSVLKTSIQNGTPYLGTSAGSNICGLTMGTTNDMPVTFPPSFHTVGIVPFNINPHYLDPDPNSTHMGETREMRIKEFHYYNTIPVVGIREGSFIEIKNDKITLKGALHARVFEQNKAPYEIEPNYDLSKLS